MMFKVYNLQEVSKSKSFSTNIRNYIFIISNYCKMDPVEKKIDVEEPSTSDSHPKFEYPRYVPVAVILYQVFEDNYSIDAG